MFYELQTLTSGLFYFGMLIPMAASASGGYALPAVYALATGLPVVAALFIGVGIYYACMIYL